MGSQLYVGRGLNSDTGDVFNVGIEFDHELKPAGGGGQRTEFFLESVTSSRELNQKLNVAASASFKGVWGVSAEFSMSSTKEVNQYYTYALIRCHVLNPPRTLRNPKLKQDARDLLVNQGWEAFAAAYGWEYVEGFIDGGTYYALLEVHTSSEAEQRDVAGKLSGYYGPFSASAKFESVLKDIQKSLAINVSVTRSGGAER